MTVLLLLSPVLRRTITFMCKMFADVLTICWFQALIAGTVEGLRRVMISLSGSNFNMKITALKFFERSETVYPATQS